jgi:hypothetical protein
MAGHARLVDRRVFQRLFQGGSAEPVRDAVAAYRNDDGGFGHALEPDCRASASQPATTELALRLLHLADAWDEGLARAACDWLTCVAPTAGGATFVLPSVADAPHAPWWAAAEGNPPSPIQTGGIAATLYDRDFAHPWLDRATAVMWDLIENLAEPGPYEMFGVLAFLGSVTLDPEAAGEVHGPLDFAPLPGSIARQLFDEATIAAHLDHLAASQRDDGGWMFNWLAWSPAAEADWRGFITVDALRVLRANGRL